MTLYDIPALILMLSSAFYIWQIMHLKPKENPQLPLQQATPLEEESLDFDVILLDLNTPIPSYRLTKPLMDALEKINYPATGRTCGLNQYGELLVCVDRQSTFYYAIPLNFFIYKKIFCNDTTANSARDADLCRHCDGVRGIFPRPTEP